MNQLATDSLLWIKGELDGLLTHARNGLEAYVEDNDSEALSRCLDCLHQVQGTLRIVEVFGAAILAEEMEAVTRGIYDKTLEETDGLFEVLMRAILQLPDYLEQVIGGQRDMPLVLLTLINELRELHGEGPLSEGALFAQTLDDRAVQLPTLPSEATRNPADIRALAKKMRPKFQAALLAWFKDENARKPLEKMATIVGKFEQAAGRPAVFELWWIVGGILEAITDRGLEPNVGLKQLLGKIDRQIKRLINDSEIDFANDPPRDVINNLLYYVGRATSRGERVTGIKQSFNLAELLPDEERLNESRAALSGPNAQLMKTVSAAIKEDIVQVKDSLDIFVRTGRRNTDELEPQAELLKKVSDTFSVLGLAGPRHELGEQIKVLKAVASGEVAADEAKLMAVAQALLDIEARLDTEMTEVAREGVSRPADGNSAEGEDGDSEYRNTFGAVIRESVVNLARVKEDLTEYSRGDATTDSISRVPGHIRQVQAGLGLLGMERPAKVLGGIREYVDQQVIAGSEPPSNESLERMADALVSVEFYLETVQSGRGDPQSMLDNAETCIEQLSITEQESAPLSVVESSPPQHSENVDPEQPETEKSAADWQEVSAVDTDEIEPTSESEAESEAKTPAAGPANPPETKTVPADEVDPEIVDIFLEEAREELTRLNEYFPRWQRGWEDREALTVVRRSFHTLKGSGRMVGARRIGEFAWAIENMLNRVIEGTIDASESIIQLVSEVIETLPALVRELEDDDPASLDIDGMVRRAEALTRNEPIAETGPAAEGGDEATVEAPGLGAGGEAEPEPENQAGSETDAESEAEVETEADGNDAASAMDPVLYDIFRKEVAGHVAIVSRFLDECDQGGPGFVDESIRRAFHTLKGSSYTAGADGIRQLSEASEHYAKSLDANHEALAGEGVGALREVVAGVEQLVADLETPSGENHDYSNLIQRLDHLSESVGKRADDDESAAEEPATADSSADEPVSETIPADDSVSMESESSEAVSDEAAADEAVTDATLADEAVTDEAVTDENATDEPVTDEAVTDEPVTDEASSDQNADQVGPIVDEPTEEDQSARLAETTATDFDPELASIFFEEARELIENIDGAMETWSENHHDDNAVANLQRDLHTFKGGARMAGLMPLGDLSHELETLLTHVGDGRAKVSDWMLKIVQQVVDRLHQMLEASIADRPLPSAGDMFDLLGRLRRGEELEEETDVERPDEAGDTASSDEPASDEPVTGDDTKSDEDAIHFRPTPEADRRQSGRIQAEVMRVRADLLESALNHAGEVGIYGSRLEQQTSSMNFNIAEFQQTVSRLRDQLRKFEIETEAQIVFQHEQEGSDERGEFDPLELDRYSQLQQLSRALMESVGDLSSLHDLLSNQARESETLLLQQSRVTTELQDSLMRTRMVPFSSQAQRLRRVVRQAARESGKEAALKLSGAEGEMDRQVLDRVLAPLEHMLRNAVVHGIESEAARKRADKPAAGQVMIGLHREGAEVVIDIIDDGAGLDIEAIRKKAIARNMMDADAELAENEIMQYIFETGFSTAEKVTKSAGRGVGMDVVASEVKQLGGAVAIDSVSGAGTKITIRLPFTLAITQALMVSVGEETFAIPLPSIEGIARIPGRDLNRWFAGELEEFTYGGRSWRLHHLSGQLGFPTPAVEEGRKSYPVLLVRSGDHYGALVAESMLGSREVVVKSIGPQLASIRGLNGATVLGDGNIMFILDAPGLLRTPQGQVAAPAVNEQPVEVDERKLVMVVDDSITVRRVTQRLLERYEMRVETAKDGVDALTRLQAVTPDALLLDIEMPRMDGYELATNIRNDERLRDIPIIMITSRTGEKHRNRAMEIGVNDYLGKPYQEADLLERIQNVIAAAGTAA